MTLEAHHLFTYHEIKAAVIRIWGEPTIDAQHDKMHRRIKHFHKRMPIIVMEQKKHRELHKKMIEDKKNGNDKN